MGWTFWRCWGSHWFADRQQCFDDLLAALDRLGIEPLGAAGDAAQSWTEYRVVGGEQGLGEAAQSIAADIGHPVLATVNPDLEVAAPVPQPTPAGETVVEVGDTVIVRFADSNHTRRFRVVHGANDPARGDVSVNSPIVDALLGNGLEEEVDLVVDGRARRVVIEKITKAA